MEEKYKILEGIEAAHREPTVASAEAYAKFIIKCAVRPMSERLEVARQFGWDAKEVKDEIFFAQYQEERTKILFPDFEKEIEKGANKLFIPEVDRAEVNFTRLTGIALNEPSLSLSNVERLLTKLISTASKVDLSLMDFREPAEDGGNQS